MGPLVCVMIICALSAKELFIAHLKSASLAFDLKAEKLTLLVFSIFRTKFSTFWKFLEVRYVLVSGIIYTVK